MSPRPESGLSDQTAAARKPAAASCNAAWCRRMPACGWDYRAPGRPGSAPPARTAGIRLHQAALHEAAAGFLAAAV